MIHSNNFHITAIGSNHIKKKGVPIICFPKGITKEDYVDFCSIVKPSAINIDYDSIVLRYWSEVVIKKNSLKRLSDDHNIEPKVDEQFKLFS